ncbi:MAG: FAD-linked oxidase C-terminal domain-containing protein, partial [Saprospiraceae bacterium]|nr:FAD-linked oxidase C-terminal domain-containing protein [Saprospiraceae bacterium]
MTDNLDALAARLEGELYDSDMWRMMYATDASVYRQMPAAVAIPKTESDLKELIRYARQYRQSIILRAAGTSLAGQCVGEGIIVDMSRHFNRIIELNREEGWVRLQPGVIRDELNEFLRPHGLFFGPNTSTANRAMLGGMVGNNSCGTTSIVYGSTRDHVLELTCLLSDGTEAVFGPLTPSEFKAKLPGEKLENRLYRQIYQELGLPEMQMSIRREYPLPQIHRRNTGYAVDLLLDAGIFQGTEKEFNFCRLLCGSEGTLAVVTEIKLQLSALPPPENAVVCAHFHDLQTALRAVLVAMKHDPYACELMDDVILECTKHNREQEKNRFFVEGSPAAILMVEFRAQERGKVRERAERLIRSLEASEPGYAYPVVEGDQTRRVWALRKAGLGLLSNVPGDAKPVACIEDTAVALKDLPAYIKEFGAMMERFGQRAVYYAHAGAGELHLRPMLNLKATEDRKLFYKISEASARLVKKYRGSLSGEHGDGRVRASFIPMMVGPDNYELLRRIKYSWDEYNIFNPGKIVDPVPMDEQIRYEAGQTTPRFDTAFDYSATEGILRMAEKCNGSGDCRKLQLSGGTMCPSYMATRDEKDTTRARANVLREILSRENPPPNPFDHPALREVMDLCLSCKGCTAECPSNVDVATLKAEYLYQLNREKGVPFRDRVFANIGGLNRRAMLAPRLGNLLMGNPVSAYLIKKILGVHPRRSLPPLHRQSLRSWWNKTGQKIPVQNARGKLWFFFDEFTDYNDVETGIKAIRLLKTLGYEVEVCEHPHSGRAHISKGMLEKARVLAEKNIEIFRDKAGPDSPLVGVEPSAVLGFRDEYPR